MHQNHNEKKKRKNTDKKKEKRNNPIENSIRNTKCSETFDPYLRF